MDKFEIQYKSYYTKDRECLIVKRFNLWCAQYKLQEKPERKGQAFFNKKMANRWQQ